MRTKARQASAPGAVNGVPPARPGRGGPGQIRAEYGLSRTAFARILGVPGLALAKWEARGSRMPPAGPGCKKSARS